MAQTIKVRNLKAYSVCFRFESKEDVHKVTVIAYDQEEAINIFTKYAIAKKLDNKIIEVIVETQHKSKSNKPLINKEFYIRQNDYVNKLFEKFNKKGEKN